MTSSPALLAPGPGAEPARDLVGAARAAIAARPKDGPAWLEARRAEAAALLDASGFPTASDEAWRFTPTRDLARTPYVLGVASVHATLRDASGIVVRTLGDVLRSEPELIEPYLGQIAPVEDGFSSLAGAAWRDGMVVFAGPRAHGRIELAIVGERGDGPVLALPRVLVIAERESDVTLIESVSTTGAAGPHLSIPVTEIVVGAGARVEHVRIHDGTAGSASLATIAVRQDRDGGYRSRAFTFGGSLSRLDLRVRFAGKGAECTLDGLYFAGGSDVVAHHTTVDHASSHCSSRQRYKGALDGTGTAVFDGTVVVRHGALGTEAHQENRNLLLSGDAVVHTKPHLRIDADDVKCSHGATVGRLDPAQLFYLRSRGMDPAVARALLTYAFLREMTASVPEDLRAALDDRIAALLPDGAMAKELA